MGTDNAQTTRRQGSEWRAAGWMLHHPIASSVPVSMATGMATLGPQSMALGAVVGAVGAIGWYRGHPATWDKHVAPQLRQLQRRWLSRAYTGKWWNDNLSYCGLHQIGPDGHPEFPRILRIRSHSPSCETVWVKMPKGQTVDAWKDAREALTGAIEAERVTIETVSKKKRIIALIVQREDPFEDVIAPGPVPTDADSIDLSAIRLGLTEYGSNWTAPIVGQHWLLAGAMGSGKSSVLWMLLRSLAPLVRDGLVRLWVADPKEVEFNMLQPVTHRYATATDGIRELIKEYWATIEQRKADLAEQGIRKFTPSRETPLEILLIDELGAVMAYDGSPKEIRESERVMSLIMSQARALGGSVVGAVQEPTKDIVAFRELITWKWCGRVTSSQHPDMVLGEDMRLRGAIGDEIPNIPAETAGIGYVVKERTRTPINVRAAYVNDNYINDIVRVAGWPMTEIATKEVSQDERK